MRIKSQLPIPIRLEILAGSRSSQQAQLSRTLSALPLLYPTEPTWRRIEGWLGAIKSAGDWFGVTDLLIAGIDLKLMALRVIEWVKFAKKCCS